MHNAAPKEQSSLLTEILVRAASIITSGQPSTATEIRKLKEVIATLVKQLKKVTSDIESLKRGMSSTGVLTEKKIPPVQVQPKKKVETRKRKWKSSTSPVQAPQLLPPPQRVIDSPPRRREPPVPRVDIYPPSARSDESEGSQMQVDEPDLVQMEINCVEKGLLRAKWMELAEAMDHLNKMMAKWRELKKEKEEHEKSQRERVQRLQKASVICSDMKERYHKACQEVKFGSQKEASANKKFAMDNYKKACRYTATVKVGSMTPVPIVNLPNSQAVSPVQRSPVPAVKVAQRRWNATCFSCRLKGHYAWGC